MSRSRVRHAGKLGQYENQIKTKGSDLGEYLLANFTASIEGAADLLSLDRVKANPPFWTRSGLKPD